MTSLVGRTDRFPPAPWTLRGWGVAAIALVDRAAAAAFVPAGATCVCVVPGKTVGGLVFLSYDDGSLAYHELNVAAGLVRVGMRFAFVLPRLYVDSAASLAGGHEIWGLPKEAAAFEIVRNADFTSIDVRQGATSVCALRCARPTYGLRLPFPLPAFGVRDDAFLFFTGRLVAQTSLARVEVNLPRDTEFAALGLERPLVGLRFGDLRLAVPAPRAVARRSPQMAYQPALHVVERNSAKAD